MTRGRRCCVTSACHSEPEAEETVRVTKSVTTESRNEAEIFNKAVQPVPHVRTRPRVFAAVPDVQNLLSFSQPEGGNPRRDEGELVV